MNDYRIIMSPRAAADLEGIHQFIAIDSSQNADAMVERILDSIDLLKQVPERPVVERQVPKIRFPVRSLVVQPYIVYFRAILPEKVVKVIHIRHAARKQPRRFD